MATKTTAKKPTKAVTHVKSNGTGALDDIKPAIGLSDAQREGVVQLLNVHLSNLHVLYIKTRNYHWNIRSPRFAELHEFFEEQYDILAESIDEFAERVRQLGGIALGTMKEFTLTATLKEQPGVVPDAQTMIENLLADHEHIIRELRGDVDRTADVFHDAGTSDFLTGAMETHEKMAWMLRAHLTGDN